MSVVSEAIHTGDGYGTSSACQNPTKQYSTFLRTGESVLMSFSPHLERATHPLELIAGHTGKRFSFFSERIVRQVRREYPPTLCRSSALDDGSSKSQRRWCDHGLRHDQVCVLCAVVFSCVRPKCRTCLLIDPPIHWLSRIDGKKRTKQQLLS